MPTDRQRELFPGQGDGREPLFGADDMELLADLADQSTDADADAGRDLIRWARS